MVLNSTNRKRIAKLFPEVEGCINLLKNVAVRLTREKTRDVQDGGETWGFAYLSYARKEARSTEERKSRSVATSGRSA